MSSILTVFAFIFSQDTLCTSKASHSKFSIQETCARAFDKEGFELAIRFMQMFEKQKSILRNRQTKFCHHTLLERVSPDVNRAKPVFNAGGLTCSMILRDRLQRSLFGYPPPPILNQSPFNFRQIESPLRFLR